MTWDVIGLLLGGLGLLFVGGELLIRGAARLGAAVGLSPLVVGLTVVAFSTSAPELAVTLQSAWRGETELAIGNIVGSNISNVLLILGLGALVAPLVVNQKLIRLDVPVMIGVSGVAWLFAADGLVTATEGVLSLAGIVAYTGFAVWQGRQEKNPAVQQEYQREYGTPRARLWREWLGPLGLVAGGVLLLIVGANGLVDGAVRIAHWFGLSELVIGLTIIAVGTSFPELATSLIATYRGQRDIAVGNVVGSNIFNLLGVLGFTALAAPAGVPVASAALHFDFPVMLTVAVACLPIFFSGHQIARWEGGVFLGYYMAYTAYLLLNATHHAALPAFSGVMVGFVLPITVITLGVVAVRALRAERKTA